MAALQRNRTDLEGTEDVTTVATRRRFDKYYG